MFSKVKEYNFRNKKFLIKSLNNLYNHKVIEHSPFLEELAQVRGWDQTYLPKILLKLFWTIKIIKP